MKKRNIYFLLLLAIIGMCENISAQSRWVGIMPMQYNPSFAGNAGKERLVTLAGYSTSRKGEKVLTKRIRNYFFYSNSAIASVSYDNFIPKIASGIGLVASWNKGEQKPYWGHVKETLFNAGLIISPKISIRGKYTISPSAEITYMHEDMFKSTVFDPDTSDLNFDMLKLRAGLMFNSEKFYVGYAHDFVPFLGNNYQRYRPSENIQVGYAFQRRKEAKSSFTLQAVVRFERYKYSDLISSFTFKYNKLILGVTTTDSFIDVLAGNPAQDAIYAGLGYQSKMIKVFYLQDLTNINYVYRGELSCRIFLSNRSKGIGLF